MKRKNLIIVLSVALGGLVVWLYINPPGRFGMCTFGCITYSGVPRPLSDFQVRSDGMTRKIDKTHDLKLENVQWLLESKPEVLIIATGWDGVTIPDQLLTHIRDCEIKVLKTGEAVTLFNKLKRDRKRVSIHVHSTC